MGLAIHNHPRYGRCHVRVFMEANSSWTCVNRIATRLESQPHLYGSVEVPRKYDSKGRAGIWTSEDTKTEYCTKIVQAMGSLRWAAPHQFIHPTAAEGGTEGCIAEMYKQLLGFSESVQEPTKGTGEPLFRKVIRSGKGGGGKDDLFMVLGICLHYMYESLSDHAFRDWCRSRGRTL